MNRSVLRRSLVWGLVLGLGCSTSGTSCSSCAEPIPGGFPADQRTNDAINAKITQKGLQFFESRVNDIIGAVAANGLGMQVPCTEQQQSFNAPIVGNVTVPIYICDYDADQACDADDTNPPVEDQVAPTTPPLHSCQVQAQVQTLSITPTQDTPTSPVKVAVELQVQVNTGTIPVLAHLGTVPIVGTSLDIQCDVEYDSNASGSPYIPFDVTLTLTLDPNYGNVLAFNVSGIDVGSMIESGDLYIGQTAGSSWWNAACDFLNIDFVKQLALDAMKGMINQQITAAVDKFRCQKCDADNPCPKDTSGNQVACDSSGLCYVDKSQDTCVPAKLGLEGRVDAGKYLESFGGSADSLLDLYAVAGGKHSDGSMSAYVQNGGIVIGMMGGTEPAVRQPDGTVQAGPGTAALCVPQRTWTAPPPPDPVDFDAAAQSISTDSGTDITSYQLGLAVSDNFINKTLFDSFQSGLLCLNVDSHVSSFLSTSLFNTFLPSLGELTHGEDAPMLIALRPKQAPTITIGKGTTKTNPDGTVVPDDPLITLQIKDMTLDFYAFIEERYTRLFSLTADLTLPLSLRPDPVNNTLTPVLADLSSAITNIQASHSEMLAEDPKIVADLLSAIIGLIQPVLATALQPVQLPTVQGFKLNILALRGVVQEPAPVPGYQHLGIFSNLGLAAQPDTVEVRTEAKLVSSFVPTKAELLGPRHLTPYAVVEVSGSGPESSSFRGYEFSYRVDGGLWSPWIRNRRIEVRSPVLELQGRHDIDFVGRDIGVPGSISRTPAPVSFLVDYEPPHVQLVLDRDTRTVRTVAHDAVSRDDELSYRYRVNGGAFASYLGPQAFTLAELGDNPSLEVQVTDRSGNVGHAVFGIPANQVGTPVKTAGEVAQGGCAQTPAMALALLGLVALFWRRRRTE